MRKLLNTPCQRRSLIVLQTLESDRFVCVRQKPSEEAQPEVVIVDLKNNNHVIRRPIKADSAIMHWSREIIALKAQQRTLQIFDLQQKQKIKSASMHEDVLFWKWWGEEQLGLVTESAIYHWNVFDAAQPSPIKLADRTPNLQVSATRALLYMLMADHLFYIG